MFRCLWSVSVKIYLRSPWEDTAVAALVSVSFDEGLDILSANGARSKRGGAVGTGYHVSTVHKQNLCKENSDSFNDPG